MRRLAVLSFLLAVGACADTNQCQAFAEHLADIVVKEKDGSVDPEMREKMVKQTIDSCSSDPPGEAALACALAAESTEAMKKCDAE